MKDQIAVLEVFLFDNLNIIKIDFGGLVTYTNK